MLDHGSLYALLRKAFSMREVGMYTKYEGVSSFLSDETDLAPISNHNIFSLLLLTVISRLVLCMNVTGVLSA